MSIQEAECKDISEPPRAGACAAAEDTMCERPPGLAVEPQASLRCPVPQPLAPSTITKGPESLRPLTSF